MKPECNIFINRDRNACKNILYIGLYYLRFQQRPIEFCRKDKKETTKKTKSKGNSSTRKKKIQ